MPQSKIPRASTSEAIFVLASSVVWLLVTIAFGSIAWGTAPFKEKITGNEEGYGPKALIAILIAMSVLGVAAFVLGAIQLWSRYLSDPPEGSQLPPPADAAND